MSQTVNVGSAVPLTASGTICKKGVVRRFICSATGTLAITAGAASGGATLVAAMTVTTGVVVELGLRVNTGAYATLASSATGTFVVE